MPTNDNAISAALVLDTSYSMTAEKYVAITKIDSKAFINCAKPGDKIAVCNYATNGYTPYSIREVTKSNSVLTDSAKIIQGLSFRGNSTNMAAGLIQGINQLKSETNSRGLVFLSDGNNNAGPGPLSVPAPAFPVFACAMGPLSNQALLQKMAANSTNGQYHYAPKVVDMMKIYNQIRSLSPNTQIIANNLDDITPDNYKYLPATVSKGNSEAQFVVSWTNTELSYTSGNPTSTQLSITLVDPKSETRSFQPTRIGSGYVVYNLPHPMAGTWHVQVLYGSSTKNLPVTIGVFEFQHNKSAQIVLQGEVPKTIKRGEPLLLKAHVTHGDEIVENATIAVEITRPKISLEDALHQYESEYEGIDIMDDRAEGMPESIAKLSALHEQKLPEVDILPHISTIHRLSEKEGHQAKLVFKETAVAGSYNIHLKVKGTSHINDSPFERCHLLSILVE